MFLSDDIQKQLRSKGIININEVVKKEGDLYIAVNVLDQNCRITSINNALSIFSIEEFLFPKDFPSSS